MAGSWLDAKTEFWSVLDSAVNVNIVSERIFFLLGSFAFGSQVEIGVQSLPIRVNTNTHTRTYMYTHSSAGVLNATVTSCLKPHRRGDDKVAIITNTITDSSSYICHWLTGEELMKKKVNSCFHEARRVHKRVLRVQTALCRWLRKRHGLVAESEEQSRPWNLFFFFFELKWLSIHKTHNQKQLLQPKKQRIYSILSIEEPDIVLLNQCMCSA